jgi:hypothetical protein
VLVTGIFQEVRTVEFNFPSNSGVLSTPDTWTVAWKRLRFTILNSKFQNCRSTRTESEKSGSTLDIVAEAGIPIDY